MTPANPTSLLVGRTGTLRGRPYRVAGRVVLSMEEAGETYYWNEFHLVSEAGETATLVFEETESGGQWRLFTLFEPPRPMTAAEAAAKRVGHVVDLDGTPAPITLVDESRVCHIEGQAPEGVEVGDVARYFNAEAGGKIWVVSWTGDEVEFYRGINLAAAQVAKAFVLPSAGRLLTPQSILTKNDASLWLRPLLRIVLPVLIFFAGLSGFLIYQNRHRPGSGSPPKPPPPPIAVGRTGTLRDTTYRVRCHALVRVAKVGSVHDRHEFLLTDPDERPVWLIYPENPGGQYFLLLEPFQPEPALSPLEAGGKVVGDPVGGEARVLDLFQTTIRSVTGEPSTLKPGAVAYHFKARAGAEQWLARWTEKSIECFRATPLAAADVKAAFAR